MKLKVHDGKYRLIDVVDIEGMFKIIESIPSKMGDHAAKVAGEVIGKSLGENIVNKNNALAYEYSEDNIKIENK